MRWDFSDIENRNELIIHGTARLDWAQRHMPVLEALGREIAERGAIRGMKIAMALHTEAKTGVLARKLSAAGANIRLASCNPLSTDDRVAAALQTEGIEVKARKGIGRDDYYSALNWTLDMEPDIIIDDGGDLVRLLHTERTELLHNILGGCEETTTGVIRLRAMQKDGRLKFPVMDVNDCAMKHLFDNRFGTGQSTLDGILNATNLTIAGMRITVCGYGWCGRGIASRLKGMGANVTVSEVDPVRAVEAAMDGFNVQSLELSAPSANMIITATGCKHVVSSEVIDNLPDGCLLANSGHFDNEIDVGYLRTLPSFAAREHVTGYHLGEKTLFLLSEGRLVNLAAGQGHPVEIMDMSFAIQAAGVEIIALKGRELPPEVIPFPVELDQRIARLKLTSMNYSTSTLTEDQKKYLESWTEGT
ncbi:MAG: adenosylhomocysteinase [Thermoplasmatota archaeon]